MSEEFRGNTATPERGSGDDGGPGDPGGGPGGRKPGLPSRIALFIRQVVAELRKVIWPTRRELISYTIVVLVFVAAIAAFVSVLDLLFAKGAFWLFGD